MQFDKYEYIYMQRNSVLYGSLVGADRSRLPEYVRDVATDSTGLYRFIISDFNKHAEAASASGGAIGYVMWAIAIYGCAADIGKPIALTAQHLRELLKIACRLKLTSNVNGVGKLLDTKQFFKAAVDDILDLHGEQIREALAKI